MPMHTAVRFAYTRYPPWKCLCSTPNDNSWFLLFLFFFVVAFSSRTTQIKRRKKKKMKLFSCSFFRSALWEISRSMCVALRRTPTKTHLSAARNYINSCFNFFIFIWFSFLNTIDSLCCCTVAPIYWRHKIKMVLCVASVSARRCQYVCARASARCDNTSVNAQCAIGCPLSWVWVCDSFWDKLLTSKPVAVDVCPSTSMIYLKIFLQFNSSFLFQPSISGTSPMQLPLLKQWRCWAVRNLAKWIASKTCSKSATHVIQRK